MTRRKNDNAIIAPGFGIRRQWPDPSDSKAPLVIQIIVQQHMIPQTADDTGMLWNCIAAGIHTYVDRIKPDPIQVNRQPAAKIAAERADLIFEGASDSDDEENKRLDECKSSTIIVRTLLDRTARKHPMFFEVRDGLNMFIEEFYIEFLAYWHTRSIEMRNKNRAEVIIYAEHVTGRRFSALFREHATSYFKLKAQRQEALLRAPESPSADTE